MPKKKVSLAIAAMLLAVQLLVGCGSAPNDAKAESLADEIRANCSRLFPVIDEIQDIPAPVCVIVKQDGSTSFLKKGDLPLAASPEEAASVLVADISEISDKSYEYSLNLSTPNGSISTRLAGNFSLEGKKDLAASLKKNFTFKAEELFLERLKTYESSLFARDYLTAINRCKDDYSEGEGKDVSGVTAMDISNPLVFMTDENHVCDPVGGNTMAFIPVEPRQYVPPSQEEYVRPNITGPVGLDFTGMIKKPDENDQSLYRLPEVLAQLEGELPGTFCFSEVVGTKYYGDFTSKSGEGAGSAHSYIMRVSVISMEGELLGYNTVSYVPPADDSFGINDQMIAIRISLDKNAMAVFSWGYLTAFWHGISA